MKRPVKAIVALAAIGFACLLIAQQVPKVEKVTETRP